MNYSFLYRKKKVDQSTLEETKLARVLNTFDLTALGECESLKSFKST